MYVDMKNLTIVPSNEYESPGEAASKQKLDGEV